ncbi:MAG: hypothetical protein HQ541_04935 [Mariniphaga sp.]|nr:hypothetical protein [Mariniphaga sp.]
MVTKENIKDLIENSKTDILYEKFIDLLPNDNDVIYEPRGLFNKGILNDTGRVTKKKGNIFLEINRPGFYDILPKGLFHEKLDDTNNQPQFIEQIENEKKVIRNLFLPFDSEIFSTIAKIERESYNHFKYSLDSEIAISLLTFFRVFDEIDLLSLYEILFIDCIAVNSKANKNFNGHAFIKKLFSKDISPYSLMVNLIENTYGNSKILRLLNIIPYSSETAGKIKDIQKLIQYVLAQNVTIYKVRNLKKYQSANLNNRIGRFSKMNTDSNSLLLGNVFLDEPVFFNIQIEIDPENMLLMSNFQNGCLNKLTKKILLYFLTFGSEYEITFLACQKNSNSENHSIFSLEPDPAVKNEDVLSARIQIFHKLKKISFYDSTSKSSMQVSLKLKLLKYFNLYYSQNFKQDSRHAHLNMNTKI